MNIALFFEQRSKWFWGVAGLLLVVLLGLVDFYTGLELMIGLFYLIPIALVSWYGGGKLGLGVTAAAALSLFLADFLGGLKYTHDAIYFWNILVWVGFFLLITWMTALMRKSYNANQELVRTDYVTGAVSVRFFYELAKNEIHRSSRYKRSFTFAYIDMDNFKTVNDNLGHSIGDRVLRVVAEIVKRQIRSVDTFARLGGDEFALLMPETDELEAKKVISRLHANLTKEMLKNSWMITFSIGSVTYNKPPKSVDEMVKLGDRAMYSIKTSTKNGVAYRLYAG
jgi:diguanylate cyclase (GGDEF)-like protein